MRHKVPCILVGHSYNAAGGSRQAAGVCVQGSYRPSSIAAHSPYSASCASLGKPAAVSWKRSSLQFWGLADVGATVPTSVLLWLTSPTWNLHSTLRRKSSGLWGGKEVLAYINTGEESVSRARSPKYSCGRKNRARSSSAWNCPSASD